MTPTAYGNAARPVYQPAVAPPRPALTQRKAGMSLISGLAPRMAGNFPGWFNRGFGSNTQMQPPMLDGAYPQMYGQQQQGGYNPMQWARTGPPPSWAMTGSMGRFGSLGQRSQPYTGLPPSLINQLLAQHASTGRAALDQSYATPQQTPMQLRSQFVPY